MAIFGYYVKIGHNFGFLRSKFEKNYQFLVLRLKFGTILGFQVKIFVFKVKFWNNCQYLVFKSKLVTILVFCGKSLKKKGQILVLRSKFVTILVF